MNAPLYTNIVQSTLVPFVRDVFPDHHQFMQDNHPKHTSRHAQYYLLESRINWWKTPPESPDLNPIEKLWHQLKAYLRREVKPRNEQQLVDGILNFWDAVDTAKCIKYIKHFRKIVSRVIELNGEATGY